MAQVGGVDRPVSGTVVDEELGEGCTNKHTEDSLFPYTGRGYTTGYSLLGSSLPAQELEAGIRGAQGTWR